MPDDRENARPHWHIPDALWAHLVLRLPSHPPHSLGCHRRRRGLSGSGRRWTGRIAMMSGWPGRRPRVSP
jgi:hypothetical protein